MPPEAIKVSPVSQRDSGEARNTAMSANFMKPIVHPALEDITVEEILHALSDPTRVAIFARIAGSGCSSNCSSFLTVCEKAIPKSTLSQHLRPIANELRDLGPPAAWNVARIFFSPPGRLVAKMRPMTTTAVQEYLDSLPEDRRAAVNAVRAAINSNLPAGYQEGIQFRMLSWYVPLAKYPAGYGGNPKEPLPLLSLASTKGHLALHMICFYGAKDLAEAFTADYKASGKKLDMGTGCLRFKKLEDLALDVVVRNLARFPIDEHIARYQSMRTKNGKAPAKKATTVKKTTTKPVVKK